ncbi:prephenate dehydratase [Mycolicibacter hiberniae]|uniref:Prephenate dehydratase n=1 Tax=Mycolicibacter hiberniae TaxID=29314 RepID=A0A7I7X850_9MYCO|nr:prephenate dehydratase [Mycolicibacter hiberniae]MCV7087434.1 prephenate dehydratase [Mycolicibacter hiberniae]ORV69017.1 prephenate dehydratase [Mycolicibacter hiberniae]BBZ25047.1 prephenate dehydratase [Mycolicibacter hiberniae]
MTRISYLGPAGTFTEAALLALTGAGRVPGADPVPLPVESTPAALDAVRTGAADYACVPIENSIEGGVTPTLDGLASGSPLQIFAETALGVAFSIVVAPGRKTGDIRTVAAHPVAAAQVRHWLAEHLPLAQVVPANSNAAAAQQVCEGEADAGVSTALAAEQRGLAALAQGVIDEPNARTRFVLVGVPAAPPPRTGADRTSVVLRLENAPGALAAALTEFGSRGIDLTRIESRPTRTELGTYLFFLDCVGHIEDAAVAQALQALRQSCAEVRYLGSWPVGPATCGARA